jgi:hypothetical protein
MFYSKKYMQFANLNICIYVVADPAYRLVVVKLSKMQASSWASTQLSKS